MTTSLQCATCRHYWGVGKCDAFPDQIPKDILVGEFAHTEPHKGDGGIQYQPIDPKHPISEIKIGNG